MNISGKLLVSVRDKKGEKGTFKSFFATFTNKDDPKYPLFVSVRFGKEIPSDKLKDKWAYLLEVEEGFFTADVWEKQARPVIVITKAKVTEKYEPKKAVAKESEEEMPF